MTLIKSLPDNPHLSDVFKKYPKNVLPLLEFHDLLLRGESPFTIAERELIAAYVSGLNSCNFCFGAHTRISKEFGIEEELILSILDDINSSEIDNKFKPILLYVKKLTLTPNKISPADVEAVSNAGWSDRAIHDAVSVCALFNFMNRFVEGMGVVPSVKVKKTQLPKKYTYKDYGRSIGIM